MPAKIHTPPVCHPKRDYYAGGKCYDCYRSAKMFRYSLKQRHKMTVAEYQQKLIAQSGRCAICHEPCERLGVDHNHTTGQRRGLLCVRCNAGLGNFREQLELFERAADYLRQWSDPCEA